MRSGPSVMAKFSVLAVVPSLKWGRQLKLEQINSSLTNIIGQSKRCSRSV